MNWLHIALCDLRRMLKDRQIIIWWLLMPLMFSYFFGMVFSQNRDNRTWMHIIKLDSHEMADVFIDSLRKPDFNVTVGGMEDEHKVTWWSRAVILPATFSESILSGKEVGLTFTKEASKGDSQRVMACQANLVRGITLFTSAIAKADVVENGWNESIKQEVVAELKKPQQLSVETKQHFTLRPSPSGMGFTLPAYLIMFTLINSIMYGGITLTNERQYKQLIRLRVAPVHPIGIFLGKIVGRMLLPIFQTLLLLLCGNLFMGVSLGDYPHALIPVVVCFSLCCSAFGILFGSVCTNETQVYAFGMLTMMVLSALGGCWWPLEFVSESYLTIAKMTPTYYALHGLQDVMAFGKGIDGILAECGFLLLFSAVLIAISVPLFQKNQG